MCVVRTAWARLRGLFAGDDRDSAAELESHLQFHIDDNLRAGIPPARRDALPC